VLVADEAEKTVDEAQAELMDGCAPARARAWFEDPEDKREEHVLETQVEITIEPPLWY
jgi:hypothetical protein